MKRLLPLVSVFLLAASARAAVIVRSASSPAAAAPRGAVPFIAGTSMAVPGARMTAPVAGASIGAAAAKISEAVGASAAASEAVAAAEAKSPSAEQGPAQEIRRIVETMKESPVEGELGAHFDGERRRESGQETVDARAESSGAASRPQSGRLARAEGSLEAPSAPEPPVPAAESASGGITFRDLLQGGLALIGGAMIAVASLFALFAGVSFFGPGAFALTMAVPYWVYGAGAAAALAAAWRLPGDSREKFGIGGGLLAIAAGLQFAGWMPAGAVGLALTAAAVLPAALGLQLLALPLLHRFPSAFVVAGALMAGFGFLASLSMLSPLNLPATAAATGVLLMFSGAGFVSAGMDAEAAKKAYELWMSRAEHVASELAGYALATVFVAAMISLFTGGIAAVTVAASALVSQLGPVLLPAVPGILGVAMISRAGNFFMGHPLFMPIGAAAIGLSAALYYYGVVSPLVAGVALTLVAVAGAGLFADEMGRQEQLRRYNHGQPKTPIGSVVGPGLLAAVGTVLLYLGGTGAVAFGGAIAAAGLIVIASGGGYFLGRRRFPY